MSYRVALLVGLLAIFANAKAHEFGDGLKVLLDAGWQASEPLTVEQAEANSLIDLEKYIELTGLRDTPRVPFGHSNEHWLRFKEQIREDDVLILLWAPDKYWTSLRGWGGYVIVRGDRIVDSFGLVVN